VLDSRLTIGQSALVTTAGDDSDWQRQYDESICREEAEEEACSVGDRRFRRSKAGLGVALVAVLVVNCIGGLVGMGRALSNQDWGLLGAAAFYALTAALMALAVAHSSWWPHRNRGTGVSATD
jgi:hypothetical protein